MNGVTAGAVNGARAAYVIHNPGQSQELNQIYNQSVTKVNGGSVPQRTASNLRSPPHNISTNRTESIEYGQAPQQLSHDRVENMGPSKGKSINNLEIESQQDLYKRKSSNGNLSNAESDDIPENMYRPERDELEGWIHREKLAKIENEELQAAGINLTKARTKSRDNLGDRVRTSSRDRLRNEFATSDGNTREEKKPKVSSPVPIHSEENEELVERSHWDLRSPEEIAADQAAFHSYAPVLRKSGSKIPVLSPNASPPETAISRKRTMSGSVSNEDSMHPSRVRTSSGRWNEESESSIPISSKSNSPTKMRQKSISGGNTISAATKTNVVRKTSTAKATSMSSDARPRTRGNDTERPRTAVNAPEGDPPWLNDMYKPDPRLPPDQQIIPTVAKRQQQMMWEESGMVPKTYDREFTPLAVHENNQNPNSQPNIVEATIEKADDSESWPLKSTRSIRNQQQPIAKPTSTVNSVQTGGYSTMPKVSSPPMSLRSPKVGTPANITTDIGAPSPNIGPPGHASTTQQTQQTPKRIQQRLQTDEDEKAQKKGCGCCIVM